MPRHPVSTRIRKPTRQTDNPAKDVGVSREPLARVIAPLQEDEEEETAEINDDDQIASPPGCSGTGDESSVPFFTPGSVPAAGTLPTQRMGGRQAAGKLQSPGHRATATEAGMRHCPSDDLTTRQSGEELAAGDAMETDEGQANEEDAMDTGFLGSLEPTAEDFMSDLLLQQLGSSGRSYRREHRACCRRVVSEM